MKKITYCKKCLYPDTKPNLFINNEGVCSACINYANRKTIDWENRKKLFFELVNKIKNSNLNTHDCIVPVSGGKDSTYQVLKALECGLTPLCVNASTDSITPIGKKNLENIKDLGVDFIEVTLNKKIRKKINRFSLETIGDISWPEHVAIFTAPIRIAIQNNIKLILWGENSQFEYGGPETAANKNVLDNIWLQEFGGLNNLRVFDLIDVDGIKKSDLIYYHYPNKEELNKANIYGLFLGHYFPWDSYEHKVIAEKNGFKSWYKKVEGSYFDFENLDNYQTGIHDYFCFLKFGYGRATAQISMDIRRGNIERSEALEFVIKNEGAFPKTYLDKSLKEILSEIEMTLDQFIDISDKFTNKKIFKTLPDGNLKKDNNLNLTKINYDN